MFELQTFISAWEEIVFTAIPDVFALCAILIGYYIWSRLEIPILEGVFWVMMSGITILFIRMGFFHFTSDMGSSLAIFYLTALVATAGVFLIHYLPLKLNDLLFLTYLLFWIRGSFGILSLKVVSLLLFLWLAICLITFRRMGKIVQNSVPAFLCYIAGLLGYCLFTILFGEFFYPRYIQFIHRYHPAMWVKAVILLLIAGILFVILAGCFVIMNCLFHSYFIQLTQYGKRYKELNRYTFGVPFGVLGIVLVLYLWCMCQQELGLWFYYMDFIGIMAAILLGSQLLAVRMLLHSVKLKEHLLQEEVDHAQMREYNSHLADNLDALRGVKHDMKNVFLTMGEYVNRSKDEEMKQYYREHIVPFASQEIRENDLYVSLQAICNEPLRAFFYYKCMQGIEQGICLDLKTDTDGSYFRQFSHMTDLSRILGIFLDNAMEEALYTEEKQVKITIRENRQAMSIRIWNQVRKDVVYRGIYAGTTTKGLGRGNGLEIAAKLIEQYDDLLWNSYFQDDGYVQMLSVGQYGTDV